MGEKPKKHHVAPEAYLKRFSERRDGEASFRISILNRRTGELQSRVRTREVFYKHFYDHIGADGQLYGSAEKPLNNRVEEPGNKVITDLLKGKGLKYTQTRDLARYLLISAYRSIWFHIDLRAFLTEHSKHHGYSSSKVLELSHRKQVEYLRALMGLPTASPNVYAEDAQLSKLFNSVSYLKIGEGGKSIEALVRSLLQRRDITLYTAPQGTEFITADNHVISIPMEDVDSFLDVPIHDSTVFIMPLSPKKLLYVSERRTARPGINLTRKTSSASEVERFNNTVCIFSSAHIFSRNEKLLCETHESQPFQEGKIVVMDGEEVSYFPHPNDLPQRFGS